MNTRKPYAERTARSKALSICVAAVLGHAQLAQAQETAPASGAELEEVVVTGYRQSLENSTAAKRDAVGFVDAIFAEDIGKFPDTNIAESFNRIPGITINRETSGEGLNIAIRGLGTNFTKVLLNGAPVSVASTGRTDAQSTNREVDLDLFPTELFSQLTVSKTPSAAMLEGGAAGTVNMRSARPFDNEGGHIAYSIQGIDNSNADDMGGRGSFVASNTWGSFGALVGVAGVHNPVKTTGFETIGWTNPNLRTPSTNPNNIITEPDAQCRPGAGDRCNTTGGGNFTIPGVVPVNAGNGLTPGDIINREFLLANNPGLTLEQIDNAIIPRLGRPAQIEGERDRYNAVASFEFRPSENFHAYLDTMYGKKENDLERIDMNWVGRNGAAIPLNLQVDRSDCSQGCVVTSGTFANAQAFLEYRPFLEEVDFYGANPGFTWQMTDRLSLDWQANYTKSEFHRESPTFLAITAPNSGMTVTYTNDGGIPNIQSSLDLNNPANFGWVGGGRVNIQDERRETETKGTRASLTFGDSVFSVSVGGAYDDVSREIRAFDNSQAWQNAVCGNQPNVYLESPNTQPACEGLNLPGGSPGAGYPTYPGFGTGFTAGLPPFSYLGSLVPNGAVQNYLRPGPGFVTLDWDRFARDTNYDQFHDNAPDAAGANTGAAGGQIREKSTGFYTEINGDTDIGDKRLRYNAGVRYVRTEQSVVGRLSIRDPRNTVNGASLPDGALYPNVVSYREENRTYENWLPSANVALNVADNAIVRVAASRSMTRANPNDLLPGLSFTNPSADTGNIGNRDLDPFLSNNIDLGFEYYTGNEGYFGVTAFRKGIEGFTVLQGTTVPFSALAEFGVTFDTLTPTQQQAINSRGGPDVATVVLNQQVNANGRLTVNGLEFNWVQPLDFLLADIGLDGFGFTANYTIVDQKGEGQVPAVAVGVAPETYNATVYYEKNGISARLSTTFAQGSQASGLNQNGIAAAALFNDDYEQWDFSSSFDFSTMFGWSDFIPQLTVDVINLFDEEQRQYFQFSNATFTQYEAGRTVIVGLRGRF
ncbi:TonB-dependent receptor [Steroidobacter sp. S1-65]|uniref:TonB-dependent receptor n=1 Tax=Steroidobacter gossypii TaxID=2805490 RepID=A0ABS1X318_9GAMM|nr:TonB-dependent receptor [Steroidobacter gossypii]MBM0107624.1 TonB-dependent receptor [Steroidobacter gossypii]